MPLGFSALKNGEIIDPERSTTLALAANDPECASLVDSIVAKRGRVLLLNQ